MSYNVMHKTSCARIDAAGARPRDPLQQEWAHLVSCSQGAFLRNGEAKNGA